MGWACTKPVCTAHLQEAATPTRKVVVESHLHATPSMGRSLLDRPSLCFIGAFGWIQRAVEARQEKEPLTWPMGNLYLFRLRLARDVDQMMEPEMTSRTASRVVTMIERDPLTAAMLTRTTRRTLHRSLLQDCAVLCLLGLGQTQA